MTSSTFGCSRCFRRPDDAERFMRHHVFERLLIDESDFIVNLRRCPACGQRFISIFTEFVDWEGGDDAQYRDLLPLTDSEADLIAEQGEAVDLEYVASLGRGRRRLQSDWPTGEKKSRTRWSSGELFITRGG